MRSDWPGLVTLVSLVQTPWPRQFGICVCVCENPFRENNAGQAELISGAAQ